MNCPVCDRSLAPTLSICPSCGAMMHDTVREELQPKISSGIAPRFEAKAEPMRERMMPRPAMTAPPVVKTVAPVVAKRIETAGLVAPKTSPTLVGFQSKNPALPDWRVQLQNAVQQRKGIQNRGEDSGQHFPVNGGTALKAEVVQRVVPAPAPMPEISDPRVANAMRRIEESRKAFPAPGTEPVKVAPAKPAPMRPFGVVQPTMRTSAAAAPARIIDTPKPKLVEPLPVAEKRDTNKLPPIHHVIKTVEEILESAIDKPIADALPLDFAQINRIRIRAEIADVETDEMIETNTDEIEDLAPFSMRFGAGLFDLIIGAFTAMLLLSPVAFTNGDWFTTAGLLTLAGACAIVMFLYMTVCLGFFGKTLGMRLFSLELVDAVENEYPTLHQAAINSSIFLLSLAFGGIGFLTVFFNEENRAAHDLLSGTILVREF